MSLFLATLIVAIALLLVGGLLVADTSFFRAALQSFPRSRAAAYALFGSGAAWFLYITATASEAVLVVPVSRLYYVAAFGVLAVLAFIYVAEFLAVRGLAVLVLIAAVPLLDAGFGSYGIAVVYKVAVYLALTAALWLGAQPWRMRDAISWLQRVPGRARWVGSLLAAYGLVLVGIAFTY
jgi:hypothetical protein